MGGRRQAIERQAAAGAAEADVLVMVVDGQAGVTAADEEIASWLRRTHPRKPVLLAVNKCENARLADIQARRPGWPALRGAAPPPTSELPDVQVQHCIGVPRVGKVADGIRNTLVPVWQSPLCLHKGLPVAGERRMPWEQSKGNLTQAAP